MGENVARRCIGVQYVKMRIHATLLLSNGICTKISIQFGISRR